MTPAEKAISDLRDWLKAPSEMRQDEAGALRVLGEIEAALAGAAALLSMGPRQGVCIWCGTEFYGEALTPEKMKAHQLQCPEHPLAALRKACEAVLLYHTRDVWDGDKGRRWIELTGHGEATSRILCDFVRAALAKAKPS